MTPDVRQQSHDDSHYLEDVLSQKYIPHRQPNPHLKKYYSGKRALPWRPSILSARVSGYQDDLDQYRKHLWEQEKMSKLREHQRLERAYKKHDPAESDDEFPKRRKRTFMPKNKSKVSGKRIKTDPQRNTREHNPRPALSHLMSTLKATSKRQGWLQYYYSYCSCCRFIWDSPRKSLEQAIKHLLPFMIYERKEEAKYKWQSIYYRPVPVEVDPVWIITRPTNPQSGRSRFHEGKEKALQIHNKKFLRKLSGGHGGRGIKAWMKQAADIQGIREPRGDVTEWTEEGDLIDLKNIATRGPVFWVRYATFKRGKLVLDERANGVSLDPDSCFGEADWDILSDGGWDIWLHEEWVCLSVSGEDGSEGEMALSWIEVDDTGEDDES
ncbi:hypothetical protein V8F33_005741 [Rhypophila sp. PSN 637]